MCRPPGWVLAPMIPSAPASGGACHGLDEALQGDAKAVVETSDHAKGESAATIQDLGNPAAAFDVMQTQRLKG